MDKFLPFIYQLISRVSGTPYNPLWEEKLPSIMRGVIFTAIFILVFILFYYKYFWKIEKLRCPFFIVVGGTLVLTLIKYGIFHYVKGYIPDRLFFFALPSPKVENLGWFILPSIIFIIFIYLRRRIELLEPTKFLASLWLFFVSFSLSVSAIRQGVYSIYDPFTRIFWEYTGNLPLVNGFYDFLHNYILLIPKLAIHTVSHPPGYTMILYFFQRYFHFSTCGLAVSAVFVGGLSVFPIYYFLRKFASDLDVRRGLQTFIFLPSVVMMSATSMETVFLFFVWLAVAVVFSGWGRGLGKSFIGGVLLALALFQNFLFLLLSPFFLFLFLYQFFSADHIGRKAILLRGVASVLGFVAFFIFLKFFTGYSIIENFSVANQVNAEWVESNFKSVPTYLIYLLMNILTFGFYFGLANICLLAPRLKYFFTRKNLILAAGFAAVIFFLLIGIFQGEVERIWLFVTPLFILPVAHSLENFEDTNFSAFLTLIFFQIIVIQTLFYTYW